jgi:hypothetical protein
MLDDGGRIFLDNGRLATAGSEILQKLIASCTKTFLSLDGPTGKCKISREALRSPLDVTGDAVSLQNRAREPSLDRGRRSCRDRRGA